MSVPARPPFDVECAAVLARLPEFPPLTVESLDAIRRPPPGFEPPTDHDLARDGLFDVRRRTVPGPSGAPEVELVVCRPMTASTPRPVVYHVHGGGMISGTPPPGAGAGARLGAGPGTRRRLGGLPARARDAVSGAGGGLLRGSAVARGARCRHRRRRRPRRRRRGERGRWVGCCS